jgi:hypothetical protein
MINVSEFFYFKGVYMKPRKYFNLVLPIEVYRELKKTAYETGQSMGGLMRQGIDLVLKNKCEDKKNEN